MLAAPPSDPPTVGWAERSDAQHRASTPPPAPIGATQIANAPRAWSSRRWASLRSAQPTHRLRTERCERLLVGWALAHRSPTLASVKALASREPLSPWERFEGAYRLPVAADARESPSEACFKPLSPWERGWGEGRAKRRLRASPSITTRLLLQLLRAGPRALPGAPGERREAVDQPAGLLAGMPAMFVTVQGCTVHEHPRAHANPERRDARRARTRGGLLFGYFLLATQEKVTRAARRADRKLWLFASSDRATKRNRGKGGAHGGPGPTLWRLRGTAACNAGRKRLIFACWSEGVGMVEERLAAQEPRLPAPAGSLRALRPALTPTPLPSLRSGSRRQRLPPAAAERRRTAPWGEGLRAPTEPRMRQLSP